jgi:hypothetical protein
MLVDYAFFCTFGRLAFVLGTFSTNFCAFFIFKLLLMRSIAIYILLFGILCGCVSTKKYNAQLAEKKSVEQLRGDVDYLYSKLLGNHPQLYWYIGENQLKAKFDSLKRSISEPMVAHDFYFKLAPLVASIRQGHTRLIPLNKRFTAKERDSLKVKKYGATPFSKLGFAIFNGKLYVVKSDSWDKSVPVGAEIVEVNGIGSDVLLSKYRSTLTADGYITTFVDRMLANRFPSFFYADFDFTDSLLCRIKLNDTTKLYTFRRAPVDTSKAKGKYKNVVKEPRKVLSKAQKDSARAEQLKRKVQGYDLESKTYSKNFEVSKSDSSVGILTLKDFSRGSYRKFYSQTFKKIDSLKLKTLVIDLRNNPGGSAADIADLYSYLVDTSFKFMSNSEVTSLRSALFTSYFQNLKGGFKVLAAPFYPLYLVGIIPRTSVGDDGKYYVRLSKKVHKPSKPTFKGEVYVLINGGSFSASCIISSMLKGTKRAYFVGEETGGAYNGTVAGMMPYFELPSSKLNARIGLFCMRPTQQANIEGRGIMPDYQLTPSLADVLSGKDPEMEWVLKRVSQKR